MSIHTIPLADFNIFYFKQALNQERPVNVSMQVYHNTPCMIPNTNNHVFYARNFLEEFGEREDFNYFENRQIQ